MYKSVIILGFFLLIFSNSLLAQGLISKKTHFSKQDTLRGSITPEREWWDLTYYHLDIKVNPDEKFISGKNLIQYLVLKNHNVIQIDLQSPLKLLKAIQNGNELIINSVGNAHFISLIDSQNIGDTNSIEVFYEGNPQEAKNAPWDGGLSWKKDENGNHFVATSCQGLGASVWWPNKDHMYDEVDSMLISVNIPKNLTNISNGRLRKIDTLNDGTHTSHWYIDNPINNYGVNINIGDYAHFSEIYEGENGPLDLDYYVLRDNLEKAKIHFQDAPKMMKAFEHWFGPYPFYEDGFKLVEVPYLGMEHQSSITYGNQYKKGYLGRDLSNTGWGLKFDYIIIHEAGHEWFANNITYKDIADMWIHEAFTTYSENLFIDYYYGKKASSDYVIGCRNRIRNDRPIIGPYNVNKSGSSDMYAKGSNVIHTLRQLVEDDNKWRQILRDLNSTFYHQTVTTQQIENFLSEQTGIDLTEFFNQYLRDTRIPTLEYQIKDGQLKYRWINIVANFDMPILVSIDSKEKWLYPKATWQQIKMSDSKFEISNDFYIYSQKI